MLDYQDDTTISLKSYLFTYGIGNPTIQINAFNVYDARDQASKYFGVDKDILKIILIRP